MDTSPIECNPQKYNYLEDDTINFTPEQITTRMNHAWDVIRPFSSLLDCEIVQFFNCNYWHLVPLDWRECLIQMSANELADLMDADNVNLNHNLPDSLSKIREDIKTLSLSRKREKYHRLTVIHPGNKEELEDYRQIYVKETDQFPFYENLINYDRRKPPLSFLKYKCKDKKLAEIVVMGDLCFKAYLQRKVDFIVDIGAGLGHLSRCLAYFYGINVVTIEKEAKMTEEALRLDEKFLKLLKSLARRDPKYTFNIKSTILRITTEITPNITSNQFEKLIIDAQLAQNEDFSELKPQNFKFGLVGLHPCGNLAPTMLNLFKNCQNCQFINIASCCYNKMSINNDPYYPNPKFIGFPLNHNENNQNGDHMGKNQLGLALHALENYQERYRTDIESFKADFYRALVEKFIENVAPEFKDKRRKNVKTIGPGGVQNFREYIKQSIPEILIDEMDEKVVKALENVKEEEDFQKILAFTALRHMFAPLLESIVLLDRLLYLKEDSSYCHVTQRFEPKISPRVHVITAFKK